MSALSHVFRFISTRTFNPTPRHLAPCISIVNRSSLKRTYADKSDISSKHIVAQGTENKDQLRVRRAQPADIPRVLRFVRENARATWPGLVPPPSASHLVLCDYVARALAQGHSMLAEQHDSRQVWSPIRGIALGIAICPWDATMLEKWARCIRCSRSSKLMDFTAHCMRAPALHEKYGVNKMLQIVLIVPRHIPKSGEIVHVLAKHAIQRGADLGFPVLRFDVTDEKIATYLDQLNLKKEWVLSYDVMPEALKLENFNTTSNLKNNTTMEDNGSVSVYTALPKKI